MQILGRIPLVLSVALAACLQANACTNCTNESPEPIEHAPAPWTLKGTVYSITIVPLLDGILHLLPEKAYSPLERNSSATDGTYIGLLGMIQIIRYTESPVGPYDELLIIPGYYNFDKVLEDGSTAQLSRVRVSRIYVSQKYTAKNGRENWNIPKHLAKFDWIENADGSSSVKIYPFDTTGDVSESYPSTKPFFQMSFKPNGIDNFFSTSDLYKLVGINATLAQPPLPQGNDAYGALAGTSQWKATVPGQSSFQTSLGTFDLDQTGGDGEGNANGTNAVGDEFYPNFWPRTPRYSLGYKQSNAVITFSAPEVWG